MNYTFTDRLKHAWNVFKSRDPTDYWNTHKEYYGGDSYRPDYNRPRFGAGSDKSIVTAIKNRIAVDAAQVDIQHVRLDDNNRYVETIYSGLNDCLSVSANIDQTGRAFRLDIFMSLLDEGVIAIVPVDTTFDPEVSGTYQINSMRVGKILQWYPQTVKVQLYNEKTGLREEILVSKKVAAIVENPFYSVMNEPNSTFQRLTHKLALLDAVDEQSSAGKLDLIIQLPYVVKTETRKQQADKRRQEIEDQLNGSKYGIAYTDGTEKIQQLNRPLENNLLSQIQYLTDLAYAQTGMTKEILNGTADEKAMLNYNNRIIEPLVAAVTDSMKRTFLTKTAITQKQSIEYFKDPFSLVPVENVADIADKFTRNEILTSNEIRQIIGIKPSDDPSADVLRNKNLYDTTGPMPGTQTDTSNGEEEGPVTEEQYQQLLDDLDNIDSQLAELSDSLDQDELTHWEEYDSKAKQWRHWYYENVEKPGKKLGYGNKTSTAGLNEEGRAYAKFIRELLSDERKAKVADSKSRTDAGIAKSKEETDAGIEKSKKSRDELISGVNAGRDRKIESERGKMSSGLETAKTERDTKIEATNAKRDSDLETERARTKAEVESHKSTMQTKIDVLKSTLASLSKEEKAAAKERIQQEIADLREENARVREDLQAAFKSFSAETRANAKAENESTRQTHKETSTKLREGFKTASNEAHSSAKSTTDKLKSAHKSVSDSLRGKHKETSAGLREQHKANTAQAKQEYEDEYARSLEWIKSQPEYQTAKKSKKKGKMDEIGTSKSGRKVYKKSE